MAMAKRITISSKENPLCITNFLVADVFNSINEAILTMAALMAVTGIHEYQTLLPLCALPGTLKSFLG